MLGAWPSGNVRRFVETKLRPELITTTTLVAGVETWKRVASPASHFRRSF